MILIIALEWTQKQTFETYIQAGEANLSKVKLTNH